jgi:hypothetical protein
MSAPVTIPAFTAHNPMAFEAGYRAAAMEQAIRQIEAGLPQYALETLKSASAFVVEGKAA